MRLRRRNRNRKDMVASIRTCNDSNPFRLGSSKFSSNNNNIQSRTRLRTDLVLRTTVGGQRRQSSINNSKVLPGTSYLTRPPRRRNRNNLNTLIHTTNLANFFLLRNNQVHLARRLHSVPVLGLREVIIARRRVRRRHLGCCRRRGCHRVGWLDRPSGWEHTVEVSEFSALLINE